jgi:hypothetical protein
MEIIDAGPISLAENNVPFVEGCPTLHFPNKSMVTSS